ncbi:MAG: hypothetical protein HOG76_12485 [Candidatus Marinimicrobia bacterium]|jgi:hypothetical protein|nr:hypothetical protein [Candidatus Neomarinimicrobiota bacterium]MBT5464867.1 hypothetical protein [Candidatus Neomarinimicrobiota bacterium]MBT6003644.1 hypothetical protein [Candidatus Neomarinimicrobiota bacterium]MBT6757987.1 hypothetical protein [Candidatus Neomarinimicrobiota bacterium]MBT7580166.1 hypothetical protein [Candidatus Neomarinimicrobiota bacterium]
MIWSTITLLGILLFSGCELFTPRDSEPPTDVQDPYAWIPPTSPEIVLQNLSNAFPAHKPNYHLDVLGSSGETGASFAFFPDQGVASSQPGVFDNWGYVEEENFITQLFEMLNEEGLPRLEWEVEQLSPIDDRYEIITDYHLTLFYGEAEPLLPEQFKGQATLTLVQNVDLLYEISVWQDLKSDTLPCWSDLKTLVH